MWSQLQAMWDGVVNLSMMFVLGCGFLLVMRAMQWKYEPGVKRRDVGLLKTGVGLTRAFLGR